MRSAWPRSSGPRTLGTSVAARPLVVQSRSLSLSIPSFKGAVPEKGCIRAMGEITSSAVAMVVTVILRQLNSTTDH